MNSLNPPLMTGVDAHAHVFSQHLPLDEHRRYSPDYDAPVTQYLMHLDQAGLSHGVLVQPSFLGTDNSYMLTALRQHTGRLRGTAVVATDVSDRVLDELAEAGVTGVRLNLVGKPLEDYTADHWQQFFRRMAQRQWSIEIQRPLIDLEQVVPAIVTAGASVVIDHFGLPDGAIDPDRAAHHAFLSWLSRGDIWIKLSASYRSGLTPEQARTSVAVLREAYGHMDRLVWGSDWPHTRFEDQTDHNAQFAALRVLLPEDAERQKVLIDNPARLFRFAS